MKKAENIASNQEPDAQTAQNVFFEDNNLISDSSHQPFSHDFNRVLFESPPSLINTPRMEMFPSSFRNHSPYPLIPPKCSRCTKEFIGGAAFPCNHKLCKECTPPRMEGCPLCQMRSLPQFPAQMFLSPMAPPGIHDDSVYHHNVSNISQGLQNISMNEAFDIWDQSKNNRNSVIFESINANDQPVFTPNRFNYPMSPPRRDDLCAVCLNGSRATGWCINCSEMLCNDCIAAHQRVRVTKEHHVVPLDNYVMQTSPQKADDLTGGGSLSGGMTASDGSSSRPSSVCCVHEARVLAICETCCGTVLCHICVQQHANHQLLPPGDIRGAALFLLGDIKQREKSVIESAESVRRMVERIEVGAQAVASELRSVIHLHMSALEERKRDLLQRLDTVRTSKLSTLKGQNDHLHSMRNRMVQVIREVEQSDSLERYYETLVQLYCQKVVLDPQETDLIKFVPPDPQLLNKIRCMGELESEACAVTSQVIGEKNRRAIRDRPTNIFIQLKDACGEISLGHTNEIRAQVLAPDGAITDCQILDKEPGLIAISYVPTIDGTHLAHIFIRGVLLADCPITIEARKGRNYLEIQTTGELFSFGREGSGDGELCRPWGICIDLLGRVLIADRSNNRVQIFDKDGNFLAKFGTSGARPGQFDRPAGITINTMNNIIVADKDNHRVQVFDENGIFLFKFGERGRPVGMFNYPWGVAANSLNQIAVSDTRNHRVQIFNAKGMFMRKCGFETAYFYKHLDSPRGLCFIQDGELLITDFNNHRLAVWSPRGNTDMKMFGVEGENEDQFCRPQGVAVDAEGNILICDSRNNRVQVLSSDDYRCIAVFGGSTSSSGFQMPTELPIPTFQTAGPSSMSPFPIGAPPPPALMRPQLDRPTDVAVSSDGRVYVVDFGNNCIRVF